METIFDYNQIKQIIPHRQPFLLIDKIVEYEEGKRCVGLKQVSGNEPFFQGHFPNYAVMPGVLITEALAQTGAVAMLNSEENKGKIALFAGIDKCRLMLEVEITKIKGPIGKGSAKATVDGQLACSCELTFAIQDA